MPATQAPKEIMARPVFKSNPVKMWCTGPELVAKTGTLLQDDWH